MTLIILAYLFALLMIYFLADALHDSWMHKEKSYYAVSKRTDISAETRTNAVRLYRIFSKQWHALDAFIKGFMIANVAYWIVGFGWELVAISGWAMFVRWIWFDACWNWFNGLSFWYRGTVAQSDTIKISDLMFFLFKFVGFAGSTVVLILMI
jgi:hypothetical protein